jgi:hypothetical protein
MFVKLVHQFQLAFKDADIIVLYSKEMDVLERVKLSEPAPLRADANPRNLQQFNELKCKSKKESGM